MSLNHPLVSIIVPTYNEQKRIRKSLGTIVDYSNEYEESTELIVVDDGSSDQTVQIAKESLAITGQVRARVICSQPNRGKGHAVRMGLLAALAPIALFQMRIFQRRSQNCRNWLSLSGRELAI